MKKYIAVTQQPCVVVMWDSGSGPPTVEVWCDGLLTALLVNSILFEEYSRMGQVTWELGTTRDEQFESCQSGVNEQCSSRSPRYLPVQTP